MERRRWRVRSKVLWQTVVILILAQMLTLHASAQEPWTKPTVVVETAQSLADPILIADSTGDLHLFLRHRRPLGVGESPTSDTIQYSRLHQGSWSRPVDILSAPDRTSIFYLAVSLDERGYFHVTWTGGRFNTLFYSRAHLSQAGTSRGWSTPKIVSEGQNLGSDIRAAHDGSLHLIYAARGADVFYRQSQDGGKNWTVPIRLSLAQEARVGTDYPRIEVDEMGRIHAVWTEYRLPDGWPPTGAYYARSLDGGKTWSPPRQMAGENYGMINIAVGFDKVVLAWNSIVTLSERVYRWSADGGETYSPPEKIISKLRGGFTGFPAMAFDSSGVLHLITSEDGQKSSLQEIYHLMWNGKNWTEPAFISEGTFGDDALAQPWISISNGNQLNVSYQGDYKRVWYTSQLTGAPALAPKPIPTPVASTNNLSSRPISSPDSAGAANSNLATEPTWVGYPLAVSTLAVIVLIVGVMVVRLRIFGR